MNIIKLRQSDQQAALKLIFRDCQEASLKISYNYNDKDDISATVFDINDLAAVKETTKKYKISENHFIAKMQYKNVIKYRLLASDQLSNIDIYATRDQILDKTEFLVEQFNDVFFDKKESLQIVEKNKNRIYLSVLHNNKEYAQIDVKLGNFNFFDELMREEVIEQRRYIDHLGYDIICDECLAYSVYEAAAYFIEKHSKRCLEKLGIKS